MTNKTRFVLTIGGFFVGALFAVTLNGCGPAPVGGTTTISSPQPTGLGPTVGQKPGKEVTKLNPPANRVVFIRGEIGPGAEGIVRNILNLGQSDEPLYIELNSPGGSVLSGAMIISAMQAAKGPVYTICDTLCASMAAMIFEHGTQRYMVDRSFVMFHPASGGAQGEVDKMASRIASIQRYIGKLEAYVAQRAGITFERYKQLSGVELWVDSEDAVNSNFADKIVSVLLPTPPPTLFGGEDHDQLHLNPNTITLDPMSRNFDLIWSL